MRSQRTIVFCVHTINYPPIPLFFKVHEPHGSKLKAAAGKGGITIVVGGTILIPLITTQGNVSQEININEALQSNANFIFDSMYIKPDMILSNPMDPNNWGFVETFAHEAIHAVQGFWNAFSVYGEAEAYYYAYQLVEEMNVLIAGYNAARDEGDAPINSVRQHPLGTALVTNMSTYNTSLWYDARVIEDFGQLDAFKGYSKDGIWGTYHGGRLP